MPPGKCSPTIPSVRVYIKLDPAKGVYGKGQGVWLGMTGSTIANIFLYVLTAKGRMRLRIR